ncbi:hypothetical protein GOODEAATRI_018705 [Goodea atripinnis]|uniref:Uncharacterized protein n=1 Tax=Goodea atripinnis TaxID=208336 RepID=A0ABV0MTA0_9TELE
MFYLSTFNQKCIHLFLHEIMFTIFIGIPGVNVGTTPFCIYIDLHFYDISQGWSKQSEESLTISLSTMEILEIPSIIPFHFTIRVHQIHDFMMQCPFTRSTGPLEEIQTHN